MIEIKREELLGCNSAHPKPMQDHLSFGISVVPEVRDRKEEYSQSENPECNGAHFLRFIVLAGYRCK